MSYLGIAFISIALVLLNAAIGCALASKGFRAQLGALAQRIVHPRRGADQ